MTINRIPADNSFFCPLPQNIFTASPKSLRSGTGGGWLQIFDECVMEWLLLLLKIGFIFFNLHLFSILLGDQSNIKNYFSYQMVVP